MFSLCEMFRWNHLPVAGGIYDQHPKMIDDFEYIAGRRAHYEAEQQKKKDREARRPVHRRK